MNCDPNPRKVKTLRDKYLAENSYNAEDYDAPRFYISVGKLVLNFPNPGKLRHHDLNHVVSGYGTGLIGEAEISAYEVRCGFPSSLILFFCIGSIIIGLGLSPSRILRAWRAAKGAQTLYRSSIPYEELLEMDVVELRRVLKIPDGGFGDRREFFVAAHK